MSAPVQAAVGAMAAATAADAMRSLPHVRVGCDVQAVEPVAHAVRRFGSRYLDRVYTSAEQAECRQGGTSSLAGRFAAKEAVLKLLGSAEGIDLREVEITRHDARPEVRLSGRAAMLAGNLRIAAIDVSISHDAGLALAVAVAESPPSHHHNQPPTHTHSGDHR